MSPGHVYTSNVHKGVRVTSSFTQVVSPADVDLLNVHKVV